MTGPQIDIMTPEYDADPNPILDDIRENHPIYFHEGLDSWVLSRHDDILEALRTPAFTTNNYAWQLEPCLLYTSPSPRDRQKSRMPSSA